MHIGKGMYQKKISHNLINAKLYSEHINRGSPLQQTIKRIYILHEYLIPCKT